LTAEQHVKIAIVDDEAGIVSLIASALSARGAPFVTADSAESAKAQILGDPAIGVVIADINLPGQSGLDMAAELTLDRADADALEFIFITGMGTTESVTEALRRGAFDFVTKPFRIPALADRAMRARARCAERRTRARHAAEVIAHMAKADTERRRLSRRLEDSASTLAQTEAALEAAREARSNLFAVISHELRTPLIPIIGFSNLLRRHACDDPEKIRNYAGVIHDAGQGLLTLVETALDILALDGGEAQLSECGASLARIAAAARDRCAWRAHDAEVSVALEGDAEAQARCDSDRMERAAAALLDNAIKATPRGGVATMRWGVGDGAEPQAWIAAEDPGEGPPPVVIRKIGQPFLQADMTTTRAWQGAGLGLAFVDRLARAQGGALSFEKLIEGGARARISWPAGGAA